ncbi:MAG: amylo-alpha-1,6-glucosidase [Acidobacteria bacterium]|nr:MAG: amylo-alpha-1,6-glucosidase [Acidobacteriota bacterium]
MFAVFDRHGDMGPAGRGEEGIFFQGTRHLTHLVASIWNLRPLLLSSSIQADNFVFTADLANVDVQSEKGNIVVPRDMVHLERSKFLWQDVSYEEFKIVHYALEPLVIPLRFTLAADFADIFEVRGTQRQKRGRRLPDEIRDDVLVLSYLGLDGALRQTHIKCHPKPKQISGSEIICEFALQPKESAHCQLTVAASIQHNSHPPQRHWMSFSSALSGASTELQAASHGLCQISSSNSRFNNWTKRSFADLNMMTLGNSERGYPCAGVPWFSTVFGRDGIITALETLWMSPSIARGVLEFLAATQADEVNAENEAEPGKILHEMRQGEMAALKEVPFGKYYGSVDSTPLFIMLAGAHYERTGDLDFLRQMWPHVLRALDWIDQHGDVDGDGFVEYARRTPKGLIQQGWKDSSDSVFYSDGILAQPPIALCEVQGYVYAAKVAAAELSSVLGDNARCAQLNSQAETLRANFEAAFWDSNLATYVLALDGKKTPCNVRASNAGHCLFTRIASPDRARLVAQTLLGPDFFSGWGVRTLGTGEVRYNPISYHNGSVWPHDNALIAAGIAHYGFKDMAGKILLGLLDVSSAVDLHRLPELFCGLPRRQSEPPTLYPVACAPQAWSAACVFLLLQACLGITVHGADNTLIFDRPYFPEGIPQLSIRGLRLGTSNADLYLERRGRSVQVRVLDQDGEVDIQVS